MECKKCGYVWEPRTPDPKECPNCKSRNYNKYNGVKKEEKKE